MIKKLFSLIIINAILIGYGSAVWANNYEGVKDFLEFREKQWPEWNLSSLKYSDIKKDLVYPSWFEGNWIVKSENLNNASEEPLYYKVRFYRNEMDEIIGDRSKNAESIGQSVFGDRLIKVKSDPKSFNNQIVYLKNDEYIDSRIIGRTQISDENLFFADELVIQKVHNNGISRLNQVEVMSKFYRCDDLDNASGNFQRKICGSQYLATYGSKIGEINLKSVTGNHYDLTFNFIDF